MKKKQNPEKKLQNLAEQCTRQIAKSGVSREDALAIVLNMLRYHSSLVMDESSHEEFVDGIKSVFRRAMLGTVAEGADDQTPDDDWIIEHAEELKAELLELAQAGAPRPAHGTVLGRALEMFTERNA